MRPCKATPKGVVLHGPIVRAVAKQALKRFVFDRLRVHGIGTLDTPMRWLMRLVVLRNIVGALFRKACLP